MRSASQAGPHLCRRWNALIQQHSNVVAGEAGIEQQ
jgi:hypothetical protein